MRDRAIVDRLIAFIESNWRGPTLGVTVALADKPRNRDQNDKARAVVREIANNAWVNGEQFNADAWWEFFAREYGPCDEVRLPSGEIVKRRLSTTEMSMRDFAEFIEQIQAYAANNLGLELSQ